MTYRELQEVSSQLNGATGKWLYAYFKAQGQSARDNGSMMVPENMAMQHEREHLLASSNTLLRLETEIKSTVSDELKRLEQLET